MHSRESEGRNARCGVRGHGPRVVFAAAAIALAALVTACATLTPGEQAPKTPSTALARPETTTLGRLVAQRAKAHPGLSGFEVVADGSRSLALRLQIAARAQRTLDVQYFLFRQDDTGQLLLGALLAAADRGVRVRLLVDDAEMVGTPSLIRPLAAHPNIEIRVFNPFAIREAPAFLRWAEFIAGNRRLNYRMHNKVFIGDNAIAMTGGRNIADSYFQASATVNVDDVDLAVVGPMVRALSRSFDLYWNDRLAIPIGALPPGEPTRVELADCRAVLAAHRRKLAGSAYVLEMQKPDVLARLRSGAWPAVWASATLAYDPPEKARAEQAADDDRLMWPRVEQAVEGTQHDLLIVSPYLVPGASEVSLLRRLRARGVRVRLLTNSLASTNMPIAHAGYIHSRVPLLEAGCELFEMRPRPGDPTGDDLFDDSDRVRVGLHAKAIIIDGRRIFLGSMNFDQRSFDINTEIGVIIDSPRIARTVAARVEAIMQPASSYRLELRTSAAGVPTITWVTDENGRTVHYVAEPDVDPLKLALVDLASLLPIDHLL